MNSHVKTFLFYPIYFFISLCIILETVLRIFSSNQDGSIVLLNKRWLILPPIKTPEIIAVDSIKNCYACYDEELGWKIRQNSDSPPLYFTNSQGFRITESRYKKDFKYDGIDILTIGGSQTEGIDVKCENSWPYLIEKLSGYNVGNFGTRGYGIDQAILSYKNTNFNPRMVILGIIPDSFERSTRIVSMGLYGRGNISKPMFDFTDSDNYDIINIPAINGAKLEREYFYGLESDLFKHEKAYHPYLFQSHRLDIFYSFRFFKMIPLQLENAHKKRIYISESGEFDYIKNIIKVFQSIAIQNKDIPIILLMGPIPNGYNDGHTPWKKTINFIDSLKIDYVDLTHELYDEVTTFPDSIYFINGGHYTPKANNIIANSLLSSKGFQELGPTKKYNEGK